MNNIASLGLRIDSSQTVAATTALDKFAAAAKPAAAGAAGFEKSTERLSKAQREALQGTISWGNNLAGPATKAVTGLDAAAVSASKSTTEIAAAGGLARHEMINLSRQIQDVGVSLVSGQSPFMVLAQQGTQIADIFGSSKTATVGGAIRQVTSGIANFLTPMRLLAGGTVLAGAAAYVAYGQWKSFALALDDTAKQAGVTTGEMAKLQAAASFKGISDDDFTKGITNFSQQVYLAKQNAGGLLDVFRANGVQVGTFTGSLEKAADLIQRAGDDQQRLVLLQQMGLPANMQWVRLLEQGSAGLARLKGQTTDFGSAANDNMAGKAREFDEAWNKAWTNFGLQSRSTIVTASGWIDSLIQKGRSGLMAAGIDVAGNLIKNGLGTPLGGVSDEFYNATGAKGRTDPNATKDPNAIKNAIALEQQRIGILGQTASVLDQVRSVELQIQSARLNGVKISEAEAQRLKKNAEEQALGVSAIKAATDAQRVEAETVGMATGQATALAAATNAINEAKRAGRPLTDENIRTINREATALGEAAQRAETMRWGYESLVRGPMQTFQQQLANGASFFDALRASGVSALNAISSKLMDMAAQNLWKSAFGGGSGGGFLSSLLGGGGAFGPQQAPLSAFPVPLNHTGYGPGDPLSNVRYVHPAHFNDAPRFHSGIGPGERAAIIRTDESVLTPGQMKALGKGSGGGQPVNITNHYTFNGVEPGMEARMRAYIDQGDQRAVSQAVRQTSKTAGNTPAYRGNFR